MSKSLRLLIVEDSEDDVLMLVRQLRRNGFSPVYEVVETEEGMNAALKKQEWDVIISDYSMPHFDGLTALEILKECGIDVPFLIVSGVIGEEVAVAAMKAGAHDYLMKNNLTRLAPAIERELQEAKERRERKRAEKALQESEERYIMATDAGNVGVWDWNIDTNDIHLDSKLKAMLGYKHREIRNHMNVWLKFVHPDDISKVMSEAQKHLDGASPIYEIEHRMLHKDGSVRWFLARGTALRNKRGKPYRVVGTNTDITDRKRAEEALHKALAEVRELKNQLQAENIYFREEIKEEYNFEEIIGASVAMQSVFRNIEKVAGTDTTVLITGETGTGKELIARAIHNRSNRADKALIKVNCAALPSGLVESELFGHEKGAFTGATSQKKGRFELADGGTLFLDEVGELSLDTQTKLLRVLQEQEFEQVGGTRTKKVNVRVIAATNRNLEEAVKIGAFRTDLFYRLNIFPIPIPPLRKRIDDIPLLTTYFLSKFSRRMGKAIDGIDPKVLQKLENYDCPGNVRELANILERAIILCDSGVLRPDHIGISMQDPTRETERSTLEAVERSHILSMLEETGWRIQGERGAAERLGLNPGTLRSRMKKLGIKRP